MTVGRGHWHNPTVHAPSGYLPALWLRNRHAMTIYANVLRRPRDIGARRERWELPDGDFLDVDRVDAPDPDASLVVICHGLEGSSNSPYARKLMEHVAARGWRGSVFHFRGCSGEPNRRPRAYHSGDNAEIACAEQN